MNLERAQEYVIQCFAGENDDSILVCRLCQLQFSSLYNKQSHYSGKLHLQTVIQNLDQLVEDSQQSITSDDSGYRVVSSLEEVAKGCHSKTIIIIPCDTTL